LPGVPIAHTAHSCGGTPKVNGVGWFIQAVHEDMHIWMRLPAHLTLKIKIVLKPTSPSCSA